MKKTRKNLLTALLGLSICSLSHAYNNAADFRDPILCKEPACFEKSIEYQIKSDEMIETLFYTLESYQRHLNDDQKYNEYLANLILNNITNRKYTPVLIQGLSLKRPDPAVIKSLVSLYENKQAVKPVKIALIRSFGDLFLFDDEHEITSDIIPSINKANEIIIEILDKSSDREEIEVASWVATRIMAQEHAKPLITRAFKRVK